jgi:lipopolysaccharide biosynthesis glycosyltransferase
MKNIFVTITNSQYMLGNLVLNYSLKKNGSKYDLLVLYDDLKDEEVKILKANNILTKKVDNIKNPYGTNRFCNVFCKLYCWNLTEYEKVIYIDNDILNIQNIDHLFDMNIDEDKIYGCCCYIGRDFSKKNNVLNTGFFLIKPSVKIYEELIKKIGKLPSYDHADQGYIHSFFKHKKVFLEEGYNFYKRRINFYESLRDKIYNLHYVGVPKPWNNPEPDKYSKLYDLWINTYKEMLENKK